MRRGQGPHQGPRERALARAERAVQAYRVAGLQRHGHRGAGKSTLARALVRALTTPHEDVPSPTFTLVQFYSGLHFPLAHFDLYRLERADEAFEIGLDEALEEGAAVIEWPERLGGRLPEDRLDIDIAISGDGRIARLSPHGAWKGRKIEF